MSPLFAFARCDWRVHIFALEPLGDDPHQMEAPGGGVCEKPPWKFDLLRPSNDGDQSTERRSRWRSSKLDAAGALRLPSHCLRSSCRQALRVGQYQLLAVQLGNSQRSGLTAKLPRARNPRFQ